MANGQNTVSAWEDDPGTGVRLERPIPDLTRPLAFTFPAAPAPAGDYEPGTPEFRYWTAAEALRRGADYWTTRTGLTLWEVGASLPVILDEGEDLNAYYDRQALNFFHGQGADGNTVYSGESPDIVCHEMGHAVLDAIKPELFDAGSQEAAAFHEAFADISAIMSALQLPSLRASVLKETGGHFYRSSRLSRLAEQLGAAIRAEDPSAVDADCLRNAVNSFTYADPTDLPSSAPATQVSSEPHSFSRIFSGAFYEALGGALQAKAANPTAPTSDELLAVANDLAGALVKAIEKAPVVPSWYAQVAAHMVIEAAAFDAKYRPVLKAVFVRRQILSLPSAHGMNQATSVAHTIALVATAPRRDPLPEVGLPAHHLGVEGLVLVRAAAQPRPFLAFAADTDATPLDPPSGTLAARAFLDDLFTRGRVNTDDVVKPEDRLDHGRRLKTHRLVPVDGGARLKRVLFDCGLCRH